jgi:flavin reductase (DIM6/NTAB) family NADH-FMN oxidoreductase RutF
MEIPADALGSEESYKLISGCVVPRPIAWVSTANEDGGTNLAPFSAFTFVCAYPPMLGFNIAPRLGQRKDTIRNIVRTNEYVIHIADETLVNELHQSSFDYAENVSETEMLGLETVASSKVGARRLAAAPISMECRLTSITDFSGTGAEFVVGKVLAFHVRDDLLNGVKIDSSRLRPLCRLAGPNYASLGETITRQAQPGCAAGV